jgi:hypothetical protein
MPVVEAVGTAVASHADPARAKQLEALLVKVVEQALAEGASTEDILRRKLAAIGAFLG